MVMENNPHMNIFCKLNITLQRALATYKNSVTNKINGPFGSFICFLLHNNGEAYFDSL